MMVYTEAQYLCILWLSRRQSYLQDISLISVSYQLLLVGGQAGADTDSPVHLQFFLSTRPNRNINYRNPTTSYETVTVL